MATLVALALGVFNSGAGITLPLTRTALDNGWLLVFGLMWLIVGIILLVWVRPTSDADEPLQHLEKRLIEFQSAQEQRGTDLHSHLRRLENRLEGMNNLAALNSFGERLADLEKAVKRIAAQVEGIDSAGSPDVSHELDNLATTLQDAHTRLDSLGDVNSRLDDMTSQVDALYVTLQDIHQRLDVIEGRGNPR